MSWLALGVLGTLVAGTAAYEKMNRHGSWAPEDDEDENFPPARRRAVVPQVVERGARRQTGLQRAQRYELALPDQTLWQLIETQRDPLLEMDFETAVCEDPRRIDALISQKIGAAFAEVFQADPAAEAQNWGGQSPMGDLYLQGMQLVRGVGGGQVTTRNLVQLTMDNMNQALFTTFPRLPVFVKAELRRQLPRFHRGLDEAADIAQRAARVAAKHKLSEENLAWRDLADFLRGHKLAMDAALAAGLPGPRGGGPPMLGPGGRRMIGGPGPGRGGRGGPFGGGNRGSRDAVTVASGNYGEFRANLDDHGDVHVEGPDTCATGRFVEGQITELDSALPQRVQEGLSDSLAKSAYGSSNKRKWSDMAFELANLGGPNGPAWEKKGVEWAREQKAREKSRKNKKKSR